jgi:hypothetical protein
MTKDHRVTDASAGFEEVTPSQAAAWLEEADQNRCISDARVRLYAEEMRQKNWMLVNQGIGFSYEGKLIDGQHRLWAIVEMNRPVTLLIVRGLDPKAQGAVDKGRGRTLSDELTMRGDTYGNFRSAYVSQCARLAIGSSRFVLNTIGAYDAWMRFVRDGVEWVCAEIARDRILRPAAVGGSLAFAYRGHAEKIEEFSLRLRDGEGLEKGEPAWTLRRYLEQRRAEGGGFRARSDSGAVVARKVLRAAEMHVTGAKHTTRLLGDQTSGVTFFARNYDTVALGRLVTPWLTQTEASKKR